MWEIYLLESHRFLAQYLTYLWAHPRFNIGKHIDYTFNL